MQIYLARNNQQAGPYTLEQVNQMLASQQVLLTDLAWHEGMSEWKTLGELTQGKLVYEPVGHTSTPFPPSQSIDTASNTNQYQTKTTAQETKTTELASIGSRAFAKIIDFVLWLPIAAIPSFYFSEEQHVQLADIQKQMQAAEFASTKAAELQQQLFQLIPPEAWQSMMIYIVVMLMIQAYFIAKSGQSIGKKLVRIKIVDVENNTQVSLIRAFWLRSVVFIILNMLLFPIITIIDYAFAISSNRQTLHDKFAKTKVIKQ
ncbi:RDD family protein [Acinetobacter suaedae]|uniref:RDD family protein n=1 Tax=Acinetobacter suaedae TaxID=2609668 RepID=A0A5P1UUF9_9GAMM|nr:RDD family protein [Acinetobacter sp. C16S1]QER39958.1 RDD family protein [Acinetobacter sp. C16S1]